MQEGFASLQKQLLDTSSGAGEQQTVTDEETSIPAVVLGNSKL